MEIVNNWIDNWKSSGGNFLFMFINDQQSGSQYKLRDAIDRESEMNPYRWATTQGSQMVCVRSGGAEGNLPRFLLHDCTL